MVMKRNAMRKNLRQSIKKSIGRYIAIAMIIALGASIFVGLRMTKTDMVATGQVYTDAQNMFDLRLISSYGWGQEQVEEIRTIDGLVDVEGVYYTDLIVTMNESTDGSVYRFYAIPEKINRLVLLGGRLPERPDECLIDGYKADDSVLGTKVYVSGENEEDTLDSLNCESFTVVGYVSSPLYMDMNRGTTSIGNGQIADCIYVPGQAFDIDYFTEIHVTIPGDYKIYSKEYNDAMDAMAEKLEPLLAPIAMDRLEQVRTEAEDAYAEGWEEYQDGLREYQDGLHEAFDELQQGYADLVDGEAQIAENEALLEDAEQQIADGRLTIQEGMVAIQSSRQTLAQSKADAYEQIADASATLFENYQEVSRNLQQVNNGMLQIDAGLIQINTGITQLESGLTQLDNGISQMEMLIGILDVGIETAQKALDLALEAEILDEELIKDLEDKLDGYIAKRDDYALQLDDLRAQRVTYGQQLEGLYTQKTELENQKATLEENKALLEEGMAAIEAGYLELEANRVQLESQLASGEAQIEAGAAQLEAAQTELDIQAQTVADGWADLEEAKADLLEGWDEYESGKSEAIQELAEARSDLNEAREELADARETIDAMTENDVHVLDRNTNVGYASLDSSSDIVEGVSRVFPAFFLLVAALVCITTMTCMVDEERTQIGTLKALGYSNAAIISKYMLYAGTSAVLGCGLGVLAGSVAFPMILWEAYKIMLFIQGNIVLTVDIGLCAVVVAAYTGVELLVTWYCCKKALEEVPAELIRPKAPTVGKQLLFEKLPFWNKVSFLNKVTIRNIFRYRQRLAMMMVGIGGCTALLLTGFGLRDSIVNIVDFQFADVTRYDLEIYFSEGQTEEDQAAFSERIAPYAQNLMFFHQTSAEMDFEDQSREIYMISADAEIRDFIDFHSGQTEIPLPGDGEMLLTTGVAEAMGIKVGDQVTVRDADMRMMTLRVSGIYDNYVYNYAIVSPQTIAQNWGVEPEQQMAFLQIQEGLDVHEVGAEVTGMEDVMNTSVSEDLAFMVRNMMDALDLVIVVIVFCAALLAATVLYNLTNININERIREIATIKVLGFNAGETALYIFKENLSLSVMGAGAGLLLGKFLLDFVMSQIKINMVWFESRAMPLSYILSIVITILVAVIVDFVFYFKLEKINMAEALKSVE